MTAFSPDPWLKLRLTRSRGANQHPRQERSVMGHEPEVTAGTGGGRPRWLVDGMNLIGSRPDRWWNDPDRAVRRLIGELDRFAAATGDDLTVVFDRRPPDVPAGRHGAAEVAFASRRGRNAADDEIVRMVAEDQAPASLTVVTSDRRLAERARELGAAVAPTSRFRRRIDQVLAADPYR
jgi:predicted RNA-binding protein with PIN domain